MWFNYDGYFLRNKTEHSRQIQQLSEPELIVNMYGSLLNWVKGQD